MVNWGKFSWCASVKTLGDCRALIETNMWWSVQRNINVPNSSEGSHNYGKEMNIKTSFMRVIVWIDVPHFCVRIWLQCCFLLGKSDVEVRATAKHYRNQHYRERRTSDSIDFSTTLIFLSKNKKPASFPGRERLLSPSDKRQKGDSRDVNLLSSACPVTKQRFCWKKKTRAQFFPHKEVS